MSSTRPALLPIDGVDRQLAGEQAGAEYYAEPENPALIVAMADISAAYSRMGRHGRSGAVVNAGCAGFFPRHPKANGKLGGVTPKSREAFAEFVQP